jgi:hypothetical protein
VCLSEKLACGNCLINLDPKGGVNVFSELKKRF